MEHPKIKSLKLFKIEDGETDRILHLHRTYDPNGNLLNEIAYAFDGEMAEKKNFVYDANQKLQEEKCEFIEEEVVELIRYSYDEKGRLAKANKSYGNEGDEDITCYSYNEVEKLVEKRSESMDGELEHKESWVYSGDKLLEHVVLNYDGKVLESSKFKFNDKGEVVEEIRYSSETEKELKILYDFIDSDAKPDTTVYNWDGKILQRSRHQFDDKKRLVKEITETVSLGVKKFTTDYFYDENGNVNETRIVDKNDNLISKTLYKRNTFNLLIEEIHFEAQLEGMEMKKSTTLTEYEFY
jgi:hypothetical protein